MDLREAHTARLQRHPWELARFQFFLDILRDHGLLSAQRVLDVGAGDAWFAQRLATHLPAGAQVDCVDANYAPGEQRDGVTLHAARPPGQWDVVLLLDVLEHVPDDRAFLTDLVDHAVPAGGRVLISVPAWQPLFTSHDTFLQHFRRYAPHQARRVCQAAGLHILQSGGLFHGLLLPRAVQKLRERTLGSPKQADPGIAWTHGRMVTATVQAALAVDNTASRWLARAGLQAPGLSWWALCRK